VLLRTSKARGAEEKSASKTVTRTVRTLVLQRIMCELSSSLGAFPYNSYFTLEDSPQRAQWNLDTWMDLFDILRQLLRRKASAVPTVGLQGLRIAILHYYPTRNHDALRTRLSLSSS